MTLKDCVVRSVAAGLALFVLGWIIYGFVLEPSGAAEAPVMWAILVGSWLTGGLLTMVLGWRGALGAAEGAKDGGLFGALMVLASGMTMHGTMTAGPALGEVIRDGAVALVMYGIAGAIVGVLSERGAEF